MNKDILTLKTSLPSLNCEYSPINIVKNYFNYKKEVELIRLETQKVKEQAKIIKKEIDARLKERLDKNNKAFQKEMLRLKTIAESLKDGKKSKKKILNKLLKLMENLNDLNISKEDREFLLLSIKILMEEIREERRAELEKIREMRDFDPNRKLLK